MAAPLETLQGGSPRISAIRTQVAQMLARQTGARRLPPVLILGETGTGKGLLARAIHQAGPHRSGPFIDVNCAAIPETLVEAELFGYERGAFTDAREAKPGLFQIAHGGTLFLDEIGLFPVLLQGKLLTALEDRAVRRLGGTRAEPIDVAMVAATSVDLKRAVSEGRFREDLYHRLAVIAVDLPPLRARGPDVLVLAEYFLARACADYGLAPRLLTPEARARLVDHRWPGNVRELANAMERVVLLSDTAEITARLFDFLTGDGRHRDNVAPNRGIRGADSPESLADTLRARIEAALGDSGGNIRRTATALGISRNTLRARMDKYGLRREQGAVAPTHPAPDAPREAKLPAPTLWERHRLSFLRARLLASSTVDTTRALEAITDKVHSFGGRVEDLSPTGIVAVFGLEPVDNPPSHAALAALAIQNAAARAREAGSAQADVVIGIHCADHFVGRCGSTIHVGADGKAVTWSILDGLVTADTGSKILVTEAVVPFLVRRFAVESIREAGQDAWVLLRRQEEAWSVIRFVGRQFEVEQLRLGFERAASGHGQVMAIVGDPGVGKSRLVWEVTRPLRTTGWAMFQTGCVSYGKTTPYLPVVDLLKSYFSVDDRDDQFETRNKVINKMVGLGEALRSAIPAVLALLDIPTEDAAWEVLDPSRRRQRTLDALRRLLVRESQEQPLLIVFEDLHWLDGETHALLDTVVESLPGARLMLLVNYRPEHCHTWGAKTYYRQLQLDPLRPDDSQQLLSSLVGDDPALTSLKQLLIHRTEGNPFFLEESVKIMLETDVLRGERGGCRPGEAPLTVPVPATVQAVLAARIDRLPPREKHLLQTAAVVGKDVPFVLLSAVAGRPADELREDLTRLQAAEFIYEARLFPDLEYTFKHALTHEVTYGGLLHERRRALHAEVVGAIETLHRERLDEHAELLAHHAVRGELGDKAVQYLQQSGTRCVARSAYADAVSYLETALGLLKSLPDSAKHARQELDLQITLGPALMAIKGQASPEVEQVYTRARVLCTQEGESPRLFHVLLGLREFYTTRGELQTAREMAEQGLAMAERQHDGALVLEAHAALGATLFYLGEFAGARSHTAQGLALYDPRQHRHLAYRGSGIDVGVLCLNHLASSLWYLGHADQSLEKGREAVSLARELGHPLSLAARCHGVPAATTSAGSPRSSASWPTRSSPWRRPSAFLNGGPRASSCEGGR